MYCSKCGYKEKEESKYCRKCGATMQLMQEIKEPLHEKRKSKKGIYISVLFVLIVCIAIAGVFVWKDQKKQALENTDNQEESTSQHTETQEEPLEELEEPKESDETVFYHYLSERLEPEYGLINQEDVSSEQTGSYPEAYGIVSALVQDIDQNGTQEMLVVVNERDIGISIIIFEMKEEEVIQSSKISQEELLTNDAVGMLSGIPPAEMAIYMKADEKQTYIFAEFLKIHEWHENFIVVMEYKNKDLHIVGDFNFVPLNMGFTSDAYYSKVLPEQWQGYNNDTLIIEDIKEKMEENNSICVFGIGKNQVGENIGVYNEYFPTGEAALKSFFEGYGVERDTLLDGFDENKFFHEGEAWRPCIPHYYADESLIKICDMYQAYITQEEFDRSTDILHETLKWTDYTDLRENEFLSPIIGDK